MSSVGEVRIMDRNLEIEWKISDFFSLTVDKYTTHTFRSPNFEFEDASWFLVCDVFRKDREMYGGYVGLYLMREDNEATVLLRYNLYIKNTNGVILKKDKCTYTFKQGKKRGYGSHKLIQRSKLFSEMSSSVLILSVKIIQKSIQSLVNGETKMKTDTTNSSCDKGKKEAQHKRVDVPIQNLKRILLDEKNCDVIFRVEGCNFNAHRTILIARSPVFALMFKDDSKEKIVRKIDIPDCSATAFDIFLLYLYTATADTMSSNNVSELYYAADKYQVADLKSECVEYMKNNLSEENFCDTMRLSLHYKESGLQETAINYFQNNVKSVIKTNQWQKYLRAFPTDANELYMKALNA